MKKKTYHPSLLQCQRQHACRCGTGFRPLLMCLRMGWWLDFQLRVSWQGKRCIYKKHKREKTSIFLYILHPSSHSLPAQYNTYLWCRERRCHGACYCWGMLVQYLIVLVGSTQAGLVYNINRFRHCRPVSRHENGQLRKKKPKKNRPSSFFLLTFQTNVKIMAIVRHVGIAVGFVCRSKRYGLWVVRFLNHGANDELGTLQFGNKNK